MMLRIGAVLIVVLLTLGGQTLAHAVTFGVLDFELNDMTLAPAQAAERERVATLKPLLEQALRAQGFGVVSIDSQAQAAADKGHGYLREHPELAAPLGKAAGADYVLIGRLHKPSFLFAYLMVRMVAVDNTQVLADTVTETKGGAAILTAKAVEAVAEKLPGTCLLQKQRSLYRQP
ncbi:MAG: DUF2380 domain-containing protein [Thiolinea sp.]